jgi:predicted membrane chloride channel (bestrophin family)
MFFATINGSWTGVPVTFIAAYMLLGLEQLSREVDRPFRESFHALPIDGICRVIKTNCIEIKERHLRLRGAAAAVI